MGFEDNPLMRWLWPLLAALAGSVTALSLRPYRRMTPLEITIALFVGATFSIFVTPWVIHAIYGPLPRINLYLLGGVFYLMASGWNIILPFLVRRVMVLVGSGRTEEVEP